MRAIVGGEVVEFADFLPCPNRELIQVNIGLVNQHGGPSRLRSDDLWRLAAKRLHQIPEILRYDGFNNLIQKTRHMLKREGIGFDQHVASFCGTRAKRDGAVLKANGPLTFGFSLNHPAATSLALARSEFVLEAPQGVYPHLLALAWPGLSAMALLSAVQRSGASSVRVVGDPKRHPVLTWILDSHLEAGCVKWQASWNIPPNADRSGNKSLLVVCELPRKRIEKIDGQVILYGPSANRAREYLPAAELIAAIDYAEVLKRRFEPYLIDLFYFDGEETRPGWLSRENLIAFRNFLAVLSSNEQAGFLGRVTKTTLNGNTFLERSEHGPQFVRYPAKEVDRPDYVKRGRPSTAPQPDRELGVGLIGGGRWPLGMIVRQMVADERVQLRGVCDRRPEVAYLAAKALPFMNHTTDPDFVLSDRKTDIVVVAPFHGVHAEFAEEALKRGKHCFLEKPPAISTDQLQRLIEAASHGGALYVGYNRRFAGLTRTVMDNLEGERGPIYMNFVMRAMDLPVNHWYYWPSNGDRIIANCCHMIDLACQAACHTKPTLVRAVPADENNIDRNVVITITFEDKSIATISYISRGRVSHGYFQEYLFARGDTFCQISGYKHLVVTRNGQTVAKENVVRDMGHRAQVKKFIESIAQHGASPVSLEATAWSALVTLAAHESARGNGKPVAPAIDMLRGVHQ